MAPMTKNYILFSVVLLLFVVAFVYAVAPVVNNVYTPVNNTAYKGNISINFTTDINANVTLNITNATGTVIAQFPPSLNSQNHEFPWNTTNGSFPDGSYNITIIAYNDTNVSADYTALSNFLVNVTVDNTKPQITNIIMTRVGYDSAVAQWTTVGFSDSRVNYSDSVSEFGGTNYDSSLVQTHYTTFSSLGSEITYYFNVTSCDAASNCNTTGPKNFTTFATPPNNGGSSASTGDDDDEELIPEIDDGFTETETMSSGETFSFSSGGDSHSAEVKTIDYGNKEVTITVSSDPQTAVIKEGDNKEFDINIDGNNDLKVTVVNIISAASVELKFESVEQLVVSDATVADDGAEPFVDDGLDEIGDVEQHRLSSGVMTWIWIVIALVVVAAAIAYSNLSKRFNRRKSRR
jgi:hypothetical protein